MSVSRVEELINYFKSHNKIREQQSHSAKVHSVGWSCDGKLLASGSFDKSVCIFSLGPDRLKQETTFRGHGGSVDQLCWHAFYPELLSTASGDKTVRIWDTRTQKCTANISTRGENINISWSPDGNTIAVGNKEDLVTFIDARVMRIRAEEQFNFECNLLPCCSKVMGTNCECQYTLMVMNEIVQGQFSQAKDNFNYVPSIHEVDEEDTDEEYVYDQDFTTVNEVQQDADVAGNVIDDASIYSNESFCSDESSDETNITTRTLNGSHIPKGTEHECEQKECKEKCESPIQDNENVNSRCCRSSMSDDKSTILKAVKCRKKNMSFTDEELRKIEWENQLLLSKIMAQQKPKEKILHENVSQSRISSSAINRKKLQRKIESENIVGVIRKKKLSKRLKFIMLMLFTIVVAASTTTTNQITCYECYNKIWMQADYFVICSKELFYILYMNQILYLDVIRFLY